MTKSINTICIPSLSDGSLVLTQTVSVKDRLDRLEVLTSRYGDEKYLEGVGSFITEASADELFTANGLRCLKESMTPAMLQGFEQNGVLLRVSGSKVYVDKYEWKSIGFIVRSDLDGKALGSVRLILRDENTDIPTLSAPEISLYEDYKSIAQTSGAELSQFARLREGTGQVAIMLLRGAYQFSKMCGIDSWVATTDDSVLRLLNGQAMHFGLPQIGNSVLYLGSKSTPIYIEMEQALLNASGYPHSAVVAEYIRGNIDSLSK